MDQTNRTTGYNLFCRELSADEDLKLLPSKQRFALYATRWSALTPERRGEFKKRAAQEKTLSPKQRKLKWNKCVKKMLKLIDEMQSLQPTSGYFVLVPQDGPPRYGGTASGNNFVLNEYDNVITEFCKELDAQATTSKTVVTVNDIRQLFNRKYAEAVDEPGKRLPYKKLSTIAIEGLPEGIVLKKPQCYGTAQLRKIWDVRDGLRCIVPSQQ